ncbi:MAG: trypsin-like serine protease [Candidatus Bathyarchaeia archaeon]
MKPLKIAVFLMLCIPTMLAMFCSTSYGITGNYTPDSTPYVGIVVLFSDAARTQAISYGTGVLISPTVVLTAGHCVTGGVAASVCFDQGPIYCSMDETGRMGYNTNQPIYNGVPIPYPEFGVIVKSGATLNQILQSSWILTTSDIGLILLDKPVQEVTTFGTLPTAGIADTLPLNTPLRVLGYGVQITQKAFSREISVSRNSATVNLLSTKFLGGDKYLKCTANAALGKGAVSKGDSGGPVLYTVNGRSVVIAVNSNVNNANSAGVSYHTRVDNLQVLNWIYGYLGIQPPAPTRYQYWQMPWMMSRGSMR